MFNLHIKIGCLGEVATKPAFPGDLFALRHSSSSLLLSKQPSAIAGLCARPGAGRHTRPLDAERGCAGAFRRFAGISPRAGGDTHDARVWPGSALPAPYGTVTGELRPPPHPEGTGLGPASTQAGTAAREPAAPTRGRDGGAVAAASTGLLRDEAPQLPALRASHRAPNSSPLPGPGGRRPTPTAKGAAHLVWREDAERAAGLSSQRLSSRRSRCCVQTLLQNEFMISLQDEERRSWP
ncbi:uncharacterized protein LOC127030227 [Gopherus flavomarginatus]|uniref:uncharacterized protein LOC127030227 n=1 Tax=Gopherus flavomarginatus TaxID=286002 RepID=UPI0021CC3AE7|nr:uncharacterized protein LOC127030227 [Gopherus flavomarginatus]